MINAGNFNKKISIVQMVNSKDEDGFPIKEERIILNCYARVQTTKGYTIITNNSDFEKALTNFTIRFPKVRITRDMMIKYRDKVYSIEYLNNVNEDDVELEIQAKVVEK